MLRAHIYEKVNNSAQVEKRWRRQTFFAGVILRPHQIGRSDFDLERVGLTQVAGRQHEFEVKFTWLSQHIGNVAGGWPIMQLSRVVALASRSVVRAAFRRTAILGRTMMFYPEPWIAHRHMH